MLKYMASVSTAFVEHRKDQGVAGTIWTPPRKNLLNYGLTFSHSFRYTIYSLTTYCHQHGDSHPTRATSLDCIMLVEFRGEAAVASSQDAHLSFSAFTIDIIATQHSPRSWEELYRMRLSLAHMPVYAVS